MPILKLHAENVGPFDKLELDLTDGNGKAHLGPHILAGVNGSGKTTVLRTIAWCLASKDSGFDFAEWKEFGRGREHLSAALQVGESLAKSRSLVRWPRPGTTYSVPETSEHELGCIAAFAPRPRLRRMDQPPLGVTDRATQNWLSFEESVSNEEIQAFWAGVFSKESLAQTRGKPSAQFTRSIEIIRKAVADILGSEFKPDVNIDGLFVQPSLHFRGAELNFSQLASGFNATLGWVLSFLLRQELFPWSPEQAASRPGLLLIDEVETHLHPRWQRQVLNGIRSAFPNTQIIVTSHSPFVISSCPEARVHILKLHEQGKAYLEESIDAPTGASVSANITDIFDVPSQFGPVIERELDAWKKLKRKNIAGTISPSESTQLREITQSLASQGEELALIVSDPPVLPQSVLDELVEAVENTR